MLRNLLREMQRKSDEPVLYCGQKLHLHAQRPVFLLLIIVSHMYQVVSLHTIIPTSQKKWGWGYGG